MQAGSRSRQGRAGCSGDQNRIQVLEMMGGETGGEEGEAVEVGAVEEEDVGFAWQRRRRQLRHARPLAILPPAPPQKWTSTPSL